MLKITDSPHCPICESEMFMMPGCGWDYDRFLCAKRGCDGEIELNSITYVKEDGTFETTIIEDEEE